MITGGIGPVVRKIQKNNQMMKRPSNQMGPNPGMYPMPMMNQYPPQQGPSMFPQKMPMAGMGPYPTGPMPMNKMDKPMPGMNPQQHNPNGIKIDPMSVQPNPKTQPMPTTTMPNPGMSNVSSPAQHQVIKTAQGQGTGDKDNIKPSEIQTVSLTIGNKKIGGNCKIVTKLFFGKKLLIFEVSENGATTEADDKNNKKKYETRFGDLEKFDVDIEGVTATIISKEKPKEPKEGGQGGVKKSGNQWPKDTDDDHNDEFGPPPYKIIVRFKESIKKTTAGKLSHLDKIKRSELPLTIAGVAPQDSQTTTPIKNPNEGIQNNGMMYKMNYPGEYDDKGTVGQNPNLVYRNSMLAQAQSHHNQHFEGQQNEKVHEEHVEGGEEDDDEENPFPPLSKEKKAEAKKFESQLKNWKENDKIDFIMEMIKPKRTPLNPNSKKIFKCPLYNCQLQKQNHNALKQHLVQKHKSVMDLGLNIDENGVFSWDPKLLDYVLM